MGRAESEVVRTTGHSERKKMKEAFTVVEKKTICVFQTVFPIKLKYFVLLSFYCDRISETSF